jgi:transcriptional regulator with XRE-family HTH domain
MPPYGGDAVAQKPVELHPTASASALFGAELRHWRELRGKSQADVAREIPCDSSLVGYVERAERTPSLEFARSCDRFLRTSGVLERLWSYLDASRRTAQPEHGGQPQIPQDAEPSPGPGPAAVPSDSAGGNGVGRPRAMAPNLDLTGGEFISVPVQTPNGVIAYVITRREFLATLTTTMPALAFPGYTAASALPATVRPADVVDLVIRGTGAIDGRSAEPSSFATVTRLLASQRQAVAPEALLSLVEAHRDSLAMLFRKAGSDPVRGDIGALLGETSIVASRLWSAIGNRSLAIANCAFARQLADRLDNPVLGATARIFESNLHSEAATLIGNDGDVLLGLRMLEEAAAIGRRLSPAARARIAAEQAQAYAVLNVRRECQEALDRARTAVAEIDDTDRTGLFSDWSPSRLLVYEGTCQLFLGEGERAAGALNQAVRLLEADQGNVNVLLAARVDLASAYAENGDLEQGCKLLGETYVRLIDMGNHRGIERARRARERLAPWEHERDVRELDERIRDRHRASGTDDS